MSIQDVISRIRSLKNVRVKAGVLKGATYEDGTSVAEVAIKNEFGDPKTPSRPFMRRAIKKYGDQWKTDFSNGLADFIAGKAELHSIANRLGVLMQACIQESIDSNIPPPNSPATIARKKARIIGNRGTPILDEHGNTAPSGSTQTLIDTGHMMKSISYEVIDEST